MVSSVRGKAISTALNVNFDVMYGSYRRPIEVSCADKVVVFGLPRSGNTWLQTMLSVVLRMPVVDPWVDIQKSGVGMCHRPLNEEIFLRTDFVHAVSLIRDIRDIAASYYTFVNSQNWLSKSGWFTTCSPPQFFYDYFFPRMDALYDMQSYWDKFSAFNLPIVRYESMTKDPAAVLHALGLQLGLTFTQVRISDAIERTRISKLRKEGVMGYEYVNPGHFGRGVVGSYKDVLPDEIIKEIEVRYGETLRRWGYL